jgi:hypothetical protein
LTSGRAAQSASNRQRKEDMNVKYKETARGGLAVNIIEC